MEDYRIKGEKVYSDNGKQALLEFLRTYFLEHAENIEDIIVQVFCPCCGHPFSHKKVITGKVGGGFGGLATGAILGAQFGIAGGPLGAIAGTIPGAILGTLFGKNIGNRFDKPVCPKCRTDFEIPKNAKIIRAVKKYEIDDVVLDNIANDIISEYHDKLSKSGFSDGQRRITDPQSLEEYKMLFVAGSRMMQQNAIEKGYRIHQRVVSRKTPKPEIEVTATTVQHNKSDE